MADLRPVTVIAALEQDMATLMSLNADSLRNLMRDFPFDPMTIVTLGPGEEKTQS